jgi:hypothetical protein
VRDNLLFVWAAENTFSRPMIQAVQEFTHLGNRPGLPLTPIIRPIIIQDKSIAGD